MTGARRRRVGWSRLASWGAVASAAATLPPERFSATWAALFCLPGILFWLLGRGAAPRSLAARLTVAVLLQVALSLIIHRTSAAPGPQAALTYLLFAPLAYATLHHRGLDALHGLFLSLCLLLIGTILRPQPAWAAVVGFVACASVVLQRESRGALTAGRTLAQRTRAHRVQRLAERAGVALACVLAFGGIYGLLHQLPAATSNRTGPLPAGRSVGVSSEFNLGGDVLGPLHLVADELVRVTDPTGAAIDDDLYLRCGSFEVADLDRWTVLPGRRVRRWDLANGSWRRAPARGMVSRELAVARLEGVSDFVYVPPGTHAIAAPARPWTLAANPVLEVVLQVGGPGAIDYTVRFQDLRLQAYRAQVANAGAPFTQLPDALRRRADLVRLATELGHDARHPATLARRLSASLRRRCSYALSEPSGPSSHALDNFLFGSRTGYCMHFASTLAILLRLRNVPCRIAVGLCNGDVIEGEPQTRVFGSQHAHAWVEIPFDGLGWVVFDPSPAATVRRTTVPAGGAGLGAGGTAEGPAPPPTAADAAANAAGLPRYAWSWLGLLAVLVVLRLRPFASARAGRPTTAALTGAAREARQQLNAMLTALRRRGLGRAPGATLERHLESLRPRPDLDWMAIAAAVRAYQDVRFGGRPLDAERRQHLAAGVRAARRVT
ncbi:MAG: transglutaminase domain-containing protein [Planctomycetota bacterium]